MKAIYTGTSVRELLEYINHSVYEIQSNVPTSEILVKIPNIFKKDFIEYLESIIGFKNPDHNLVNSFHSDEIPFIIFNGCKCTFDSPTMDIFIYTPRWCEYDAIDLRKNKFNHIIYWQKL